MSEEEINEAVIRNLFEEGQHLHREYMASKDRDERRGEAPGLVVAWGDLRLQLREGLPPTAQALLDKLYNNFTKFNAPVSDELVQVVLAIRKQPQIAKWLK